MINLRYHIVSITAVFLALGIGLAFGAAFIDRATVDALERNLTQIEEDNEQLEAVNDQLARELVAAAEVNAGLVTEGLPQLVEGRLADVPVLLLAAQGTGDDTVAAAEQAVVDAGAQTPGVLVVTDRFALDDEDEVEDLRTILGVPTADADALRSMVTRRLRTVFVTASEPPDEEGAEGTPASEPAPMPPLVQSLLDEGFLELDASEAPPSTFALVPEAGLRLVVVSGPDADVAEDDFLVPLLEELLRAGPTEAQPLPIVVAAQPTIDPVDEEGDEEPPVPFVELLRADEALRDRLSTVDDLDPFHGLLAAVLALERAPAGQRGHYGTSSTAQFLLPPPVGAAAGDG